MPFHRQIAPRLFERRVRPANIQTRFDHLNLQYGGIEVRKLRGDCDRLARAGLNGRMRNCGRRIRGSRDERCGGESEK